MQPTWVTVRGIGNSFPAKASILMPLVGYLILFNEHLIRHFQPLVPWLNSPSNAAGKLWLVETGVLYFYYFGFLFFGIASAIYYAAGSQLIRRYKDFLDYASSESRDITLEELREICHRIMKSKEGQPKILEPIRIVIDGSGHKTPELARTILYAHYHWENNRNKVFIWICAAFYGIGFVLLSYPSIQATVGISGHLLSRF